MAKRIGKYKISKKESALSILDGGTITGTVNMSASLFTSPTDNSNPGVAGQLFISRSIGKITDITGSADFVLISRG